MGRGPLRRGLERALRAAPENQIGTSDAALIELARHLADKLDVWQVIVGWAVRDADGNGRPVVPAHDNTTAGTYAKVLGSLGLTPEARGALAQQRPGQSSGKLAQLRSVERAR